MPTRFEHGTESRQYPRLKLPAMYTLVRVRPKGAARYRWAGHIYDISVSGMRFELDDAIKPGTWVEARATLPGGSPVTVRLSGRVVRLHDDSQEPGPVRMSMTFDRQIRSIDRQRLNQYLSGSGLLAA